MHSFAGSDSTASTMQSFFWLVMSHPRVHAALTSEIEEAVRAGTVPATGNVQWTESQGLVYFQACLKEALRIHNPVPMGLPRVAPKGGLTIGDKTLPEGTTVSVSPWVIHHSKEIWGPDAVRLIFNMHLTFDCEENP